MIMPDELRNIRDRAARVAVNPQKERAALQVLMCQDVPRLVECFERMESALQHIKYSLDPSRQLNPETEKTLDEWMREERWAREMLFVVLVGLYGPEHGRRIARENVEDYGWPDDGEPEKTEKPQRRSKQ